MAEIALTKLASGKELYVEKHNPITPGEREEPPIVFIHGALGSSLTFAPCPPAFPTRTCILYDVEGHGHSPRTTPDISMHTLVQDIDDIVTHFGMGDKEIDLVAHGVGTILGMHFARTRPKRVRRLVLVGPPLLPIPEEARSRIKDRADSLREAGVHSMVPLITQLGLGSKARENAEIRKVIEREIMRQDADGVARFIEALSEFHWDGKLPGVTVFVVAAKEDAMSNYKACKKIAKLTQGKLVEMNTGHNVTFEDPEGFTAALKTMLSCSESKE
ncbi:alpha/beta-hydrolase [Rickenella mellea]|uniref:Alpha/beta-hydrolase n=1 Tax=Rickenella mellea TaxID=50990 RepID=A0A4Y7Q4D0_9AGAM|nr:alpha/beta-hydrolase [Rickenella mellea]